MRTQMKQKIMPARTNSPLITIQAELFHNGLQTTAMTAPVYFNSLRLTGADLKTRRIKAGGETERILSFFEAHPNEMFAPFEVESRLFPDAHARHITNVRRSLTTLTKMGKLEKTSEKRKDPATGEMAFCWRSR